MSTPTPEDDPRARSIRARCHELAPVAGELERNLAVIEASIADAVASGVRLLVLPELATSGYYLTPEEAQACAFQLDAPHFARWARILPPDGVLVTGFVERHGGVLFNSAAVITAAGVAGVYRKTHLWDAEADLFRPGDLAPPIVDTPVGRLGLLICYDLEFPEMPRRLALAGADLIAVPTNWPLVPRPDGEHPPEVIQAMAAARASAIPILCCDRRGAERGSEWTEGTAAVGSDGWLVGRKNGDGVLDVTVSLSPTRTKIGERNDVFHDRRPELYA
ncbi:nitrilase-related carbon-nitrogen hydrolase [Lysobacter korlensis]|uniref:Nitrilase-related carbon-nitrogen hydrolase n=1 Tax=Lysobacter korlensis TaxID=553636 RepID=A0ABV6RWK8_9GAMM